MGDSQIRVSAILETPRVFSLESSPAWWDEARGVFGAQGGEVPRYAAWRIELEGYRIGRRLLFRGDLDATLGLSCAWCVEPIDYDIHERVELLLEPAQNVPDVPPGGIELDPEDIGLARYAGETLDFGPVILEILALAWPMQPCASPDCPDKCPNWLSSRAGSSRPATGDASRPFAGLDELLRKSTGDK